MVCCARMVEAEVGCVMLFFQLAPFLIVATLAVAAVLSHLFEDNLLQRIGLSATFFGAALSAWALAKGAPESFNSFVLMAYGLAIYGAGTTKKVWMNK